MKIFNREKISLSFVLAVLFLFVFVFFWLSVYSPLLLGIRSVSETMAIISGDEGKIFSLGALVSALAHSWPGVLLCAAFSFFFLDLRKFTAILVVILATILFLSGLTLDVVRVELSEFNSLFVFSQFVTWSLPFVAIDFFKWEKELTLKEFFLKRLNIRARLGILKSSSIRLCKELLIVAALLAIGKIPLVFTESLSYDYAGSFFVETGVVFFFSFFILGGFLFLVEEGLTQIKHALLVLWILFMGLFFYLIFVPLVLTLVFTPIFLPFEKSGLRAGIVHAPGAGYFLTFYCIKTFLYSGIGGIINFVFFLFALVYTTGDFTAELDAKKPVFSKPLIGFMALVIVGFGAVFYSGTQGKGGDDLLYPKTLLDMKTSSTDVLATDGKLFLVNSYNKTISIHDPKSGKEESKFFLDFKTEKMGSHNFMYFHGCMMPEKNTLALGGIMKALSQKVYYAVFYLIDIEKKTITKTAEIHVPEEARFGTIIRSGENFIGLMTETKSRKFSAYSIPDGKLLWINEIPGAGNSSVFFQEGPFVYVFTKSYKNEFIKPNPFSGFSKTYKPRPGNILIYNFYTGSYSLFDITKGTVSEEGDNICSVVKNNCLALKKDGRFSYSGDNGSLLWEESPDCSTSYGYFNEGERIVCPTDHKILGYDTRNGKQSWDYSLRDDSSFKRRFFIHGEYIVYVKDYSSKQIVTVMLLDRATGEIRGRWSETGFELRGVDVDAAGVIYLALKGEDGKPDRLVAVGF